MHTESARTPILNYTPGGGVSPPTPGIDQRAGNLYYWPDITSLTGGDAETDLDAQNIYGLPADSLIIVVIEDRGESHWLRAFSDTPGPVTDTNAGIIVPTNFDDADRPYLLRRQIGW